jgi:hypothetical protein
METIKFPMTTTTAKMSTLKRWSDSGDIILEKLGTSVNDDPVLFTTILEKLDLTYLCFCKIEEPEYDRYFVKFVEWCLHGLLPFVHESGGFGNSKLLCGKAIKSLLLSAGKPERESEEKLAASVLKFMYDESLAKSQGAPPWLDSKEAAKTEFLKAALSLVKTYAKGFYVLDEVMKAGSKGIALMAAGFHNKSNADGSLLLFDRPETESNLTEPPEKWRIAFEHFQGKVYDYYVAALKELMTYGTLPVVSYPLELDSLIQFASTDGYNSAFYMVP